MLMYLVAFVVIALTAPQPHPTHEPALVGVWHDVPVSAESECETTLVFFGDGRFASLRCHRYAKFCEKTETVGKWSNTKDSIVVRVTARVTYHGRRGDDDEEYCSFIRGTVRRHKPRPVETLSWQFPRKDESPVPESAPFLWKTTIGGQSFWRVTEDARSYCGAIQSAAQWCHAVP